MRFAFSNIDGLISAALVEDSTSFDATTDALISSEHVAEASIISKSNGIVSGLEVSEFVFKKMDNSLDYSYKATDGDKVVEYQPVATIKGSFASILKGERTALNFLQRMSGISTLVSKYVDAVSGTNAKIVDTRKTLPGHRILDKYAVKIGGGGNHRINLSDGILIKDNHINFLKNNGYSLSEIINKARSNAGFGLKIEIEVETYKDAVNSVKSGADIVLLDNMPLDEMEKTVSYLRTIDKNVIIEASGGIGLNNVSNIAKTGVDIISVGALTHSVIAHDFSLISSCEDFTE